MRIFAVDLAAKFSAAVLLDGDRIAWQTDSWGCEEGEFIDRLTWPWWELASPDPDVMVVEDLPHRLPFAALVKKVCRLQGRIVDRMDAINALDTVLFVPPAVWRKHYTGLERGTGPNAVVPVSAALGYTPPDLHARGSKTTARKVATDYCAAWLIASWAADMHTQHGTFDVGGTSRYTTAPLGRQ